MLTLFIALKLCSLLSLTRSLHRSPYDEFAAREYLEYVDAQDSAFCYEGTLADWRYSSNLTANNLEALLANGVRIAQYSREQWPEIVKFPWKTFKDQDIVRKFTELSVLGTAALPNEKYKKLKGTIDEMRGIYGKATVCDYFNKTSCKHALEPEITERFANSRDPEELKWLWTAWRNASGKQLKHLYPTYVNLSNEAARLNNFTDNAEYWLKSFESDEFRENIEELWQQLRPLYLQLHAYVRRRLREQYGEEIVSKKGPIPAHLLGTVWGNTWENILNITMPFPEKPSLDVSQALRDQKYTVKKMFELAEEFYVSFNLSAMTPEFWKNSILEKPLDGRDLICHPSAVDMCDGTDFRIKMCSVVSLQYLKIIHHEMGHIEYYMHYKDQPLVYREGANPGFHEAIGDTITLSVSTPKHLRKINLLNTTTDDEESDINQLFLSALEKIAFLPYGYLIDSYRWGIFRGEITPDDYNCKWWELREKYQGLEPPVDRSEADFDAGAKFHVAIGVSYIEYFVSFVIQFQFHKALCTEAGQYNSQDPNSEPLYKCDIYQSHSAGALLKKMMSMGSSKPWPDAMEEITGQRKMDASALLEFFSTLQKWLTDENARTGEYIGWEPTSRACLKNSS